MFAKEREKNGRKQTFLQIINIHNLQCMSRPIYPVRDAPNFIKQRTKLLHQKITLFERPHKIFQYDNK